MAGGLVAGATGGYLIQRIANWVNERAHRHHLATRSVPARSPAPAIAAVPASSGGMRLLGMVSP